uniref:Uncharacterized protein n=1 Tax=Populus trichocarpa TaxID=3694 RepID=B9N3E2_POPTR
MDVATLDDQVIARNRKVHWYTTSNHLNMTVPKIYPTTPSTEEEWSERKTDGGIAESYSSVSTYAESENEAQIDVEEIEAAIKEISDNFAELLKTTPPARSKET